MTAFSVYEVIMALVAGALAGIIIVGAANSRLKSANADVLQALQQSTGPLYTVCLFLIGGLPVACMWLVGTLRTAPTALDAIAMIVMIGLAMLASLTLYGNMLKLLAARMSAVQPR